jgi:hypothetical protein
VTAATFESGTSTPTHLTLRYTLTRVTHTLDYRPGTATQFIRLTALTLAEVAPARRPWPSRTEARATAAETLDTYSHLWPDSEDRTRKAIDAVLGAPAGSPRTDGAVEL